MGLNIMSDHLCVWDCGLTWAKLLKADIYSEQFAIDHAWDMQPMLSDLAIWSMECDLAKGINIDEVINKFAALKDRKRKFRFSRDIH